MPDPPYVAAVCCLAGLAVLAGCDRVFGLTVVATGDGADSDGADATLPPGLVRWYPMDALEGQTIPELVEMRVATCSAATGCPSPTPGKRDGALDFSGSVYATSIMHPDLTAMTVAGWLRVTSIPDSADPYACPLSRPFGTMIANSWQLCVIEAGKYLAVVGNTTVRSTSSVPVGAWVHIALGFAGGTMSLYVNGVREATDPATLVFDSNPIVIGGDLNNNQVTGNFSGALDDVRIYDRELSVVELADLMALASP